MASKEYQEAYSAILKINDQMELRSLADLMKIRFGSLTQEKVAQFIRGSRVEFDGKFGLVKGKIQSLNTKTITVLGDDGRVWRVSPGLLRSES